MELHRYTRILNIFSIYFESITIQPKVGVYSILTTLNEVLILIFSVHLHFYPTLSYNEHYFYPTLSYLIASIPKLPLKKLSWETANCVLPVWHLSRWHEIVLHGYTYLSPAPASVSLLGEGLVSLVPAQLLQGPTPFWLFSLHLHLLLPHTS